MENNAIAGKGWAVDCSANFDVAAAQYMIQAGFRPNLIIAMQANPSPRLNAA